MCFFGESLNEEPGFDVLSCIAGGFDMRFHPADGRWNCDLGRTEADTGGHWRGACSAADAADEADKLSSFESRERSGG